jgi:hypothetical protein
MNITIDNTRHLGVGDTIFATDYIAMQDDENQYDFIAVGGEYDGHILDGTEEYEFRRLNVQDPIDLICIENDIVTMMGRAALVVAIENVVVLDRKQRDYGSRNISEFGEMGILMRVWDKICRLKNLMGKETAMNESIDDSWLDMANYAIIAILVRRGIWK